MKKAIFLLVLLAAVSLFSACSRQDDAAESEDVPPAAESEVEKPAAESEPTAAPAGEPDGVEPLPEEMTAEEEGSIVEATEAANSIEGQGADAEDALPQETAAAYEPTLLPSPCYFMMPEGLSEEDVTCGMVEMPMDRSRPDGEKVRLPYVIVKSSNPEPRPDPFLYLVGGPGGSIVNRLTEQYHEWDPFRAEHDLIFYNQRGTVLTEPYIECNQYIGGQDFEGTRAEIEAQMPEVWRPVQEDTLSLPACLEIYREKGIDFTQYNSLTNAQDTADLMQVLGYDEYNLYGLSYGTRLALSVMRDRPEQVRAVILDSNFPPNLDTMSVTASSGYEAGLQLFKECAADETCNEAFPDLEAHFAELRTRLAEEPLATGDEFLPEINEVDLITHLMNAGANPHVMAYVPLTIEQFYNGSSDVYIRLANRELPPREVNGDVSPIPPPERDFDYAEMNELSNDYGTAVEALADIDREQYVQTRYEFVKELMQGDSRDHLMAFTENFPPATAADLQERMEALSDDGLKTMLTLLSFDFLVHIDTSDLVNMLVNCYDDYNFSSYDETNAPNVYDLPEEMLESDKESNRDTRAKCSLIPTGRGPDWMIEPVSSDIPTLVFQGLADNNTPPSWSAAMLPTLSNHLYVEVPASPHGVIQMGECITDIAQDFLNDPDQEPDSSCVDQFEPVFVIEPPPTESAAAGTVFAPRTEEWACDLFIPAGEVKGDSIQCGYVVVPAERDNPDSKEVKLAFILLKATGNEPAADPILHVAGGPGLSATSPDNMVELLQRYAPLRKTRDIILYDQRGVGNSHPMLDCFAVIEQDADEVLDTSENITRCQEGLRTHGYPASTFTTAVSAADLVDMMRALGYPAYNLYGISYGSRVLMSLMHHFPAEALVRTVILDSVDTLPESVNTAYIAETYLLQQTLFESIFAACAADPACAEAYPDLRSRFDRLLVQLDQTPLILDEYTTIDGDSFYSYFFPYHPDVQNIPYLPRMIAELEQGNTTTLNLIVSGGIPQPGTIISYMPTEPDAAQDLRDLYEVCWSESVTYGDSLTPQLIELWDADVGEISAHLSTLCTEEKSAPIVAILKEYPRIFNYHIIYNVSDALFKVNSDLNSKLNCTEQYPFRQDLSDIEERLRQAQLPQFFIELTLEQINSLADGCEVWQDALETPTPSVYGSYPTLILNGQFDRLTPLAYAETAAADIPQAQYVPIPNAPHSIMGNYGDCTTVITLQFLTNPDEAVDAGCTEEMQPVFVLPDVD